MQDATLLLNDPPVPVEGRPGVFVRILSQTEWEKWCTVVKNAKDGSTDPGVVYGALVRIAACDAGGSRLFGDADPIQDTLNRKALRAVYDAAFAANQMSDEALEAEKKDSGETPANASGSSSAAPSA